MQIRVSILVGHDVIYRWLQRDGGVKLFLFSFKHARSQFYSLFFMVGLGSMHGSNFIDFSDLRIGGGLDFNHEFWPHFSFY